jgi:hypothetical protein
MDGRIKGHVYINLKLKKQAFQFAVLGWPVINHP